VEVICATETPTPVYDLERWEVVEEVLLMSGCQLPAGGSIPLIDSHSRHSTASIRGSVRDLRIEGDKLVGRAVYSSTAEESFTKVREGHLDSFSTGYRQLESVWVEEGTRVSIEGREFIGPKRVTTRWEPRELSEVIIPADVAATTRAAAQHHTEANMPNNVTDRAEEQGQRAATASAHDVPANDPAGQSGGESQRMTPEEAAQRAAEIMLIGERAGMPADVIRAAVGDPAKTVDSFRRDAFEHAFPRREAPVTQPEVVTDERDKLRAAVTDALLLRGGVPLEKPAAGAEDLMGYTLRELARDLLVRSGKRARGSSMEMVGRAMTSSDLPAVLSNVAHRSMMEGWDQEEHTYEEWTGDGSVSDFKPHTMVGLGAFPDLEQVGESSEYTHGSMDDTSATYRINTYGKILVISRQMIINDDLDALVVIPMRMGEAARRLEADLTYDLLLSAANLPDGNPLFHESRGNLLDADSYSLTAMGAARAAMRKVTNFDGTPLNIVPRFLLTSVDQEFAAAQLLQSPVVGTQAAPNLINPLQGALKVVAESRLAGLGNDFIMAAAKGKTIKRYYLEGQRQPRMEGRKGWSVDGEEMKISHDVGVALVDWRGLNKTSVA
jgi:hypothetical protein